MAGNWKCIPADLRTKLQEVLLEDVEKSVNYDLKKNPSKYLDSTLKMCKATGDGMKIGFLPTRRSNIPYHVLTRRARKRAVGSGGR